MVRFTPRNSTEIYVSPACTEYRKYPASDLGGIFIHHALCSIGHWIWLSRTRESFHQADVHPAACSTPKFCASREPLLAPKKPKFTCIYEGVTLFAFAFSRNPSGGEQGDSPAGRETLPAKVHSRNGTGLILKSTRP